MEKLPEVVKAFLSRSKASSKVSFVNEILEPSKDIIESLALGILRIPSNYFVKV